MNRVLQEHPNGAWTATKAWVSILALIMLSFSINTLLRFSSQNSHALRQWLASPYGMVGLDILRSACGLAVVFLIAGPASVLGFASRAGMSQAPSFAGWLFAWLGAGIGLFELYSITKQWAPPSASAESARAYGGGVWFYYVCSTVIIAPFYEETIMRGFLYKAFRSRYAIWASILFVVLVVGYFHWGLLSKPLFFADLIVGAVVLCLLREWTDRTWNCVLFHAAHNATVSLRWPFYVGGMLLALPLCIKLSSVELVKGRNRNEKG